MKNLKDFLTEGKVNLKEKIYKYSCEDLADAETFDEILVEEEPVYVLKANDFNEEDAEIRVNGSWEFFASENTNFYGEKDFPKNQDPKKGDLVFEDFGTFALYRPGLGVPSGFAEENIVLGTKQELIDNLLEYKKEMKSDWGCDVEKLLNN